MRLCVTQQVRKGRVGGNGLALQPLGPTCLLAYLPEWQLYQLTRQVVQVVGGQPQQECSVVQGWDTAWQPLVGIWLSYVEAILACATGMCTAQGFTTGVPLLTEGPVLLPSNLRRS